MQYVRLPKVELDKLIARMKKLSTQQAQEAEEATREFNQGLHRGYADCADVIANDIAFTFQVCGKVEGEPEPAETGNAPAK